MFLIESYTQLFYDVTNISDGKSQRLPDTYINKDYASAIKFIKITSNSTHNRQKRQKEQNNKKLKNADLHKPVLNKIKTPSE